MKRVSIALIAIIAFQFNIMAQTGVARFLSSGMEDLDQLTEAYMSPFGKGFGAAMNAGWYNTGATHKFMGFDFTLQSTVVSVPVSDGSFDLDIYPWKHLKPGTNSVTPTISGEGQGAVVGLEYEGGEINNLYEMPKGIGFNVVPLPMVQLGVGVFKGTDVVFRFFPVVDFSDFGRIGMLGFGLKHDIKQWIPGVKKLPFDMAVQGAWSYLSGQYNKVEYYPTEVVNVEFERIDPLLPTTDSELANDYYRTQDLTLTTNAWNMNFIVSKKISVLTGFASIGYSSSNLNIGLNGKYLLPEFIPMTGDGYNAAEDSNNDGFVSVLDHENEINDPIDANIKYSSVNMSAGIRLQLAVVALHATYVYQDYSMINFGLGFSFR